MPDFEEYCAEIQDIWDSHWLTNNGAKHRALKQELQKYLQSDDLALFTNGHLALETVIAAMHLQGEVITTPFTFVSTTHAIVRNGLRPVFCDIKADDYTIDASKIEALITENTSAIIPVHVYGHICDYKAIEHIAQKHNLKVIYDAAHAFGVHAEDCPVSQMGDASMYSFHATKVFNTIEGGAVAFKDPALHAVLTQLRNFGITGPESIESIGGNAKMNEFQAAMGLCNLRHIDASIAKRKDIVVRYRELLGGVDGIQLVAPQKGIASNYAYFPVVFQGYKYSRDEICQKLAEHNIFARKYFYPLTNHCDCYGYNGHTTPVAQRISESVVTLPLYADLSLEDVEKICTIILK